MFKLSQILIKNGFIITCLIIIIPFSQLNQNVVLLGNF